MGHKVKEQVMSLRTDVEHEEFMGSVSSFENRLVRSGVKLDETRHFEYENG